RTATLFRKEGLVVVAAVYSVVIQQSRNPAKADQAKGAVGCRPGCQKSEIGPAPPVDRELIDGRLTDIRGEFLGVYVDRGSARDDVHGGLRRAEAQYRVDVAQSSDLDHQLLLFVLTETAGGDGQPVCARLQVGEAEPAVAVSSRGLRLIGVHAFQCDSRIRHHRVIRVG